MVKGWDGEDVKVIDTATRHPKWVRVEPGTLIAKGQPYRSEYSGGYAEEDHFRSDRTIPLDTSGEYFIDSTWSPPLELPTEPTWGIVVDPDGHLYGPYRWRFNAIKNRFYSLPISPQYGLGLDRVADFIPLTPEQVARIEAAR